MSDMTVDISVSHHYVCMIDNHSGPQATTGMIDADMKARNYDLVYDCKTPGRHVCVCMRDAAIALLLTTRASNVNLIKLIILLLVMLMV